VTKDEAKYEAKYDAMTSEELDRVAGGIIIVSGFTRQFVLVRQASALDWVVLNPHPHPRPPMTFSFGH
jgi:hypothetical protein